MLKTVIATATVAGLVFGFSTAASADPQVCVDVYVEVNGTVVEQAACVPE